MTSHPDAGTRRSVGAAFLLWLTRIALATAAILFFVLPEPDLTRIGFSWFLYGIGVFIVGVLLLTFTLDGSWDMAVMGIGICFAFIALGLYCLLHPEEALRNQGDLFSDTSNLDDEPDLTDVYFGGVIGLVLGIGPILWWLWILVQDRVRVPRRTRSKSSRSRKTSSTAGSLFDDTQPKR